MWVVDQAVISGFTFFLADLSAQAQEGRAGETLDRKRLLRCSLAGLLMHGPLFHLWFERLDRTFIVSQVVFNLLH